ncbi:YbjO family protein [Yersinia enterocolitica]|uniref:Glycine/betaine ABC transporter permease n=1 Tax=Yersinia enterocolitica TaxID=630 RepID=A0A9P1M2X8_YEREN|nr:MULTISPECIES: YbjO family protein [Yersinia]AKF37672.1 membrane protein [Yersinia enterocolitica]ALG45739.1 membrane protein [Yersinia enterocolitica]EKN3336498.1 YbjO family protein [Yersinia enterocolitica]EKN3340801.1 YbjO family protein [Yersinia enterocolitica]EKN3384645.1 YbjO family protein [Yersinia enterocolitica]
MRLLFSPAAFSSAATTPVPVLIAGIAIIATRFVGVILLVATLGWGGTGSFIYESLQSWDSGLIFIASILILLLEMVCGVAVCLRQNWARWCYVACQLLVVVYLLMASLDWLVLDVDVFRIEGDTGAEILHSLLLQKIPDVVILGLLFFPWHRYFRSPK